MTLEKNSDESAAYINQWISRTVGVQGWLNHLSAERASERSTVYLTGCVMLVLRALSGICTQCIYP